MANSLFSKVPVEVPNRSGFKMDHENAWTGRCGTLYPIFTDYLLPGDKVSLGHSLEVNFVPFATTPYGRLNMKLEAFFVPYRLLYGGWQRVVANFGANGSSQSNVPRAYTPVLVPLSPESLVNGSLADMLGLKSDRTASGYNIFPFLAYHRIYDDMYRDKRNQTPVFQYGGNNSTSLSNLPFYTITSNSLSSRKFTLNDNLNDGLNLGSLRQRNFAKDYFVNATKGPQLGNPLSVSFKFDPSDTDGDGNVETGFTIAQLRQANALQQFAERNNLAGFDYESSIRANYGVSPASCQHCEVVFLGQQVVPVYTKGVMQTTPASADGNNDTNNSNNPFGTTVGAKFGSSMAVDASSLIGSFEAREHGILMVLASLVPDRLYSTGTRRQLLEYDYSDVPQPILAGVGDQEIKGIELSSNPSSRGVTFGYAQRYAHYKFMNDEVHGEFRKTLNSFILSDGFNSPTPQLTSQFLKIPDNYLNQIKAFSSDVATNIDFWADSYFMYNKVSCLPAYSLPTLGDMKNTHTEFIDNGGKRL